MATCREIACGLLDWFAALFTPQQAETITAAFEWVESNPITAATWASIGSALILLFILRLNAFTSTKGKGIEKAANFTGWAGVGVLFAFDALVVICVGFTIPPLATLLFMGGLCGAAILSLFAQALLVNRSVPVWHWQTMGVTVASAALVWIALVWPVYANVQVL